MVLPRFGLQKHHHLPLAENVPAHPGELSGVKYWLVLCGNKPSSALLEKIVAHNAHIVMGDDQSGNRLLWRCYRLHWIATHCSEARSLEGVVSP